MGAKGWSICSLCKNENLVLMRSGLNCARSNKNSWYGLIRHSINQDHIIEILRFSFTSVCAATTSLNTTCIKT